MRRRWRDLFRSLGEALFELLQAELAALGEDLRSSGRRLWGALVLLLVALFAAFWACGALALVLVESLAASGLPRWGAALIVLGLLLAGAAAFGAAGWLRLRRLESPADTVRRHVDDTLDWWQVRVLEAGETGEGDEQEERP